MLNIRLVIGGMFCVKLKLEMVMVSGWLVVGVKCLCISCCRLLVDILVVEMIMFVYCCSGLSSLCLVVMFEVVGMLVVSGW